MEIWFCVDQVPDKWTEKGGGALVQSRTAGSYREIEKRGLNNGCSWNKR